LPLCAAQGEVAAMGVLTGFGMRGSCWLLFSFAFSSSMAASPPSTANCTWVKMRQPVSHFAPGAANGATFELRVCVYDGYWGGAERGAPIFFYTGNESPVDGFINASGLMWETAPAMGALLVWAEHRYFGDSIPTLNGTQRCLSFLTSSEALADFASVLQTFRRDPSWRWHAPSSPVIAFGGSYGGMLAAWMRMKYPSLVEGAIAASAPIWGFPPSNPELDGASMAITRAASADGGADARCVPNLRAAWVLFHDAAKSAEGRAMISTSMGLCHPLESTGDAEALLHHLQGSLFSLAMGSYPFASGYMTSPAEPLPAWPMRVMCESLADDFGVRTRGDVSQNRFVVEAGGGVEVSVEWSRTSSNGYGASELGKSGVPNLLAATVRGLNVWFNSSGKKQCFHWTNHLAGSAAAPGRPLAYRPQQLAPLALASRLHAGSHVNLLPPTGVAPSTDEICGTQELTVDLAWLAICCNDGNNIISTAGQGLGRDLFWPPNLPEGATMEDAVNASMGFCGKYAAKGFYGLPSSPDEWSKWMDVAYGGKRIEAHTQIFFSNGRIDPWASAGVLGRAPTPELPTALIEEGAHHLDLFFSSPGDPESVVQVRARERQSIAQWVATAHARHASAAMVADMPTSPASAGASMAGASMAGAGFAASVLLAVIVAKSSRRQRQWPTDAEFAEPLWS